MSSASSSSAATPASSDSAAAASTPSAPSKLVNRRWGLLKRALIKAAGSDGNSAATEGSVRAHAGFKVCQRQELTDVATIAALNPPLSFDDSNHSSSCSSAASTSSAQSSSPNSSLLSSMQRFHYLQYDLPPRFLPSTPLLFRIRRASSVSLKELAPDQKVDNTGNICIWNTEEVMMHVALSTLFPAQLDSNTANSPQTHQTNSAAIDPPVSPLTLPELPQPSSPRPLRILELGAGMSGLCGMAFALAARLASTSQLASSTPISDVVITDGNAGCVDGINYQLAWNYDFQQQHLSSHSSTVASSSITQPPSASSAAPLHPTATASLLAWDRNADYSHLGKFDLILAADWSVISHNIAIFTFKHNSHVSWFLPSFLALLMCFSLFFTRYHEDLCHVLRSLLVPDTGRAWLLAPTRGGSLQQFVDVVKREQQGSSTPQLAITQQLDHYDPVIWSQHQQFLQESSSQSSSASSSAYSPDLHYPLLLVLKATQRQE